MNGEIFDYPESGDRDALGDDSINPPTQFEIESLLALLEERSESGSVLSFGTEVELVNKRNPTNINNIRIFVYNDSPRLNPELVASIMSMEPEGKNPNSFLVTHYYLKKEDPDSFAITKKEEPLVFDTNPKASRIFPGSEFTTDEDEIKKLEDITDMSFVSKVDIRELIDLIREAEVYNLD